MAITLARPRASLLRDPGFRRVWLLGMATGVGRWLEMLVVGIYAVNVTGSPFLVALLVILRMAPMALFGPIVGTYADRLPPRLLLGVGMALATTTSACVLALFLAHLDSYGVVAVASFVSGVIWTTDLPLRRRMLGDIAGPERLAAAMGFDSATSNGTRMLGPLAGGALYQWTGAGGAFALSGTLYICSLLLILGLPAGHALHAGQARAERVLRQLREAAAFALRDRDILRILVVTVIFNIWGFPFLSMIPVIGAQELRLDPGWIGVLASMEGLGSFIGALAVAMTARPAWFRRLYVCGPLGYMVFAFVVGSVAAALPAGAALLFLGMSGSCFSTMQSTLIYATAPPAMRGRLFGLLVLCIGSGLIGFTNIGLMGNWLGAATAVRIVAAEGLVPLIVLAATWRELWRGGRPPIPKS